MHISASLILGKFTKPEKALATKLAWDPGFDILLSD